MRRFSEDFKTVFGDDAKIFQATADFARQIHARLDRDDIANLERSFIARRKHGELMNIAVDYPDREADFAYEETYGYNWPLVYRMMGDWHQQHIDWSYTEQTGLERPIAHGVSSAGVAMRHVISLLFPGHPEAMTRFKCRFTSPVLPGVRLRTVVWKTAEGEARFRMVNADAPDSKPFLNNGIVEWDPERA